jgi:hypothetical protein
MPTPAEIKAAASKVLATLITDTDFDAIAKVGAICVACDTVSANRTQYRQIGHPEQLRRLALNEDDVAHDLAGALQIDLLSAHELIDDVMYSALSGPSA